MAIFKLKREIIDSENEDVGDRICEIIIDGAKANLRKWMNSRGRDMGQAVGKIEKGEGSPTGDHAYHGLPVRHASAGVSGRTGNISIFYVVGTSQTAGIRILGIGEHTSSTKYKLAWKDHAWKSCAGMLIDLKKD